MQFDLLFLMNSVLLGVGLAMDAFSVSLANGLKEPNMGKKRLCTIAGVFAFFQAAMPMIGWVCVHTIAEHFHSFSNLIPWIALVLLWWIGGKMLLESLHHHAHSESELAAGPGVTGPAALLMQGVATSIDALSVGFTIAEYEWFLALICTLIIAAVTFGICSAGLVLGKTFGTKLEKKAGILGGVILIMIGIEIFLKGVL